MILINNTIGLAVDDNGTFGLTIDSRPDFDAIDILNNRADRVTSTLYHDLIEHTHSQVGSGEADEIIALGAALSSGFFSPILLMKDLRNLITDILDEYSEEGQITQARLLDWLRIPTFRVKKDADFAHMWEICKETFRYGGFSKKLVYQIARLLWLGFNRLENSGLNPIHCQNEIYKISTIIGFCEKFFAGSKFEPYLEQERIDIWLEDPDYQILSELRLNVVGESDSLRIYSDPAYVDLVIRSYDLMAYAGADVDDEY